MKTNISKSKMTRAGAIILAVITLLSTIFIIPANAEYQTAIGAALAYIKKIETSPVR